MKKVGIIVGIVVLLAVVFLAIPMESKVERSVVVNADRSLVFENVSKFENFIKWSPWSKIDTTQKVIIAGEDGTLGAKYSWESSNDEVGTGSQTITKINENEIEMDLEFTAPWQSVSKVYFMFEDVAEGVKVTWGYRGEENLMVKLMVEGMLEDCYDDGLSGLKTICEK